MTGDTYIFTCTGHFADFEQFKNDSHFADFRQVKIDPASFYFLTFGQVTIILPNLGRLLGHKK